MKVVKSTRRWGTIRVGPNRWSNQVVLLYYQASGSFNFERQWYHDGIVLRQFSSLAFVYLHLFFLCSAAAGCVSTATKSEPCCSEQDHISHSTKGLHITFVSGSASTQRHGEIGLNDQIWEKHIHECPWQKCSHFVSCHAVDNVLLTSPSHWKRLFTAVLFAASPSIEIHFQCNDRLNWDMPRISDLYMMLESLSSNNFFNISSILPSSEPNQLQQKSMLEITDPSRIYRSAAIKSFATSRMWCFVPSHLPGVLDDIGNLEDYADDTWYHPKKKLRWQ